MHVQVTREDAVWFANLHHLRHFKTLHLAAPNDTSTSNRDSSDGSEDRMPASACGNNGSKALMIHTSDGKGMGPRGKSNPSEGFKNVVILRHYGVWQQLPEWIHEQGLLLSAGRLPQHKQAALAAVGVTLRVERLEVERSVLLQVWARELFERASP